MQTTAATAAIDARPADLTRAVLDAIDHQTAVLDRRGRIVLVNQAWERFALVADAEPSRTGVGVDYLAQCDGATGTPAERALARRVGDGIRAVIARRRARFEVDYACTTPAGELWFELSAVPCLDGAVVTHLDITERKRAEAALRHAASHDELTGLANRRAAVDRLAEASCTGVLLVDLDDFAGINDSLGHAVGDRLLRLVAGRLRAAAPPADLVARLDSDQFLVITTATGDLRAYGEELGAAVAAPTAIDGSPLRLSARVGIAAWDARRSAPRLLQAADLALAEAKRRAGRGGLAVYEPWMRGAADRRVQLGTELRHAIDHDELVLHYQPQFDVVTGELCGLEALVRWDHPTRGLLAPGAFLDVAQQVGAMPAIGRWVLAAVVGQQRAWLAAGLAPCPVSVNVTADELRQPGFAAAVLERCREAGVPPELLQVEITEEALVVDRVSSAAALRELQDGGVEIAVDDFGTGYSSLAYLADLPIDVLKIDRSFVGKLLVEPGTRPIVEIIVHLARTLHLATVAEGVEDAAQLDALGELGCDVVQGFHLSRPVPPEVVADLLAAC